MGQQRLEFSQRYVATLHGRIPAPCEREGWLCWFDGRGGRRRMRIGRGNRRWGHGSLKLNDIFRDRLDLPHINDLDAGEVINGYHLKFHSGGQQNLSVPDLYLERLR